jgi:hypothetical protein
MSAKNFSHAACNHPATKVARAKCRRQMAASVAVLVATVTDSPIITAWNAMKTGPLELTAAPIVEEITIADEVTRENWREYKNRPVIVLTNDDEPTTRGSITGWSANLVQIKSDTGKTVRIPAGNVVTVVTDNA